MALKNFSWVLPGKLAGSDIPGRGSGSEDSIRKDLQQLSDEGIRCLVSLEHPSVSIESFCDQFGLKWNYFPIPDFDVPQNGDDFSRLINDIIKTFESGNPVCVHCHAGIGRTGLVLSCVVGRYFGISAGKSIKTVRMTRKALDTPEQERFVNVFLDQSHES